MTARFCLESNFVASGRFALWVLISAFAALLLSNASVAQNGLPRNALWEVVHYVCVPGQSQRRNPTPCVSVELNGGIENGFAILKDLRGPAKFLLIPTVQIDGIESPILLSPNAPNYFAHAWNARKYLDVALGKPLPRSGIGLAINSAKSRNQDQLHIHIACVYSEVFEALKKNQGLIGNEWAPFKPFLLGQHYFARWIAGENLGENNPFVLLAKTLPGAAQDMDNWTLAVIGFTRIDGTEGFVILADQFNSETRDWASGEELLDNSCGIAAVQK